MTAGSAHQVHRPRGQRRRTIEWDETHPVAKELGLDNWTEEQWLAAFESGLNKEVTE